MAILALAAKILLAVLLCGVALLGAFLFVVATGGAIVGWISVLGRDVTHVLSTG